MSKKRLLITHYDLDGMGCDILLSNMFQISKKHRYGYAKIKEAIESPDALTYDSVLITDVSLTEEQFKRLFDHYGEAFLFVDHHPASTDLIRGYNFGGKPQPTIHVTEAMSATAIIAKEMNKYLAVPDGNIMPFMKMAMYVDAYDMWRWKSHPDLFKVGYNLNTVFWRLGFSQFFSKFNKGFKGFDNEDLKFIKEHDSLKSKSLERSDKTMFNDTSMFVCGAESKYVNDYTLTYPDVDVFYIVYMYNDMPRVGVRTNLSNVELGPIVKEMVNRFDCVLSAGGHPQAAGVDFIKDTTINDISKVAEEIDEEIRKW